MELDNIAMKLNKEIKESNIYKDYINKKNALYEDENNLNRYKAFIDKHNNYKLDEGLPNFNTEEVLASEYGQLLLSNNIREYIKAKTLLIDKLMEMEKIVLDLDINIY